VSFDKHGFAISPRISREFCYELPALSNQRAQGTPDARCTRGLVCKNAQKKHTSIQVQRRQSGIPCAMVLMVSFALSPVIGLSCHRHFADFSAKLDASVGASGPHDLMSSRFFGLLKTSEVPENKGFFRFLLNERKARRNPPGPDRP